MLKSPTADKAIHSAELMLKNTQRSASDALDNMGHALDHGMERAREASADLRDSAQRASLYTINGIKHEPVKSVLIAAAAGAALVALFNLLTRSSSRY